MTEFKEIRSFKGRSVRSKTLTGYEKLFEDLMEYSSFTNVNDIQSQTDLNQFFRDVKSDAEGRGRKFTISSEFKSQMGSAFRRLVGKPAKRVVTRRTQVDEGRFFTDFSTAKQSNLTTTNARGFEVFKTTITVKKKGVVRYRDSKGRFRGKPKGD